MIPKTCKTYSNIIIFKIIEIRQSLHVERRFTIQKKRQTPQRLALVNQSINVIVIPKFIFFAGNLPQYVTRKEKTLELYGSQEC